MLPARIKVHGRAIARMAAFHPELTALRRHLHAHPEIGVEEHDKAQRVVTSPKACGVALTHGRQRGSGQMMACVPICTRCP
jgi:metal-dependent amidase/aminoacylase/carboxypeptidase family protein